MVEILSEGVPEKVCPTLSAGTPSFRPGRTTNMNSHVKRVRRQQILDRDGNRCHWCHQEFSEELPPTFDHLLPRKRGGSDKIENMVLACRSCNNGRANPKGKK